MLQTSYICSTNGNSEASVVGLIPSVRRDVISFIPTLLSRREPRTFDFTSSTGRSLPPLLPWKRKDGGGYTRKIRLGPRLGLGDKKPATARRLSLAAGYLEKRGAAVVIQPLLALNDSPAPCSLRFAVVLNR